MRRIFAAASLASMFFLFSCSSSRKANFVPFTRDLKQRLERDNIDLRQVQFYVDQKLILYRNLGDQKLEVHSGVVKMENGKVINEVIVPAFTPGICDTIQSDKLMVSFEKGNNDLALALAAVILSTNMCCMAPNGRMERLPSPSTPINSGPVAAPAR